MSIQVTPKAQAKMQAILAKNPQAKAIRFFTRVSGCTGYSQEIALAEEIHQDDIVFEQEGFKLVVAQDDLPKLDGTTIDYETGNLLSEGFSYHNPNVKDACGCGSSVNFG